ncbi:hypothetical protein AA106555_1240 [Neokomagataea thailandica NBRC 106555]|uniref:Uncharacterized protein n=1 Tax=Neokomagataea thailandica NBRC 106555 TaxID=1223520 RepID=A0ABQ0QQG1_9PROT|nr:hypothetical protein AA106555_1240 [Neokomagataea thailandica NBRC 106555]
MKIAENKPTCSAVPALPGQTTLSIDTIRHEKMTNPGTPEFISACAYKLCGCCTQTGNVGCVAAILLNQVGSTNDDA